MKPNLDSERRLRWRRSYLFEHRLGTADQLDRPDPRWLCSRETLEWGTAATTHSPFQIHAALSRSGFRLVEVERRFAERFVIPPQPTAPALIIERNPTALKQPLCQRPEMIPVVKKRFGVAEIRDNDSPSPVLVHGLVDHDERIRREIAAAAGFVQLGGVPEIVNSCVGSFKQKKSVAILLLAVQEHPALQRSNVAPIRRAELQALV